MTASKIVLYLCLSFILGIFLASFLKIPLVLLGGMAIFGLILAAVFWGQKTAAVFGFCILFLVAGAWRYQQVKYNSNYSDLRKYSGQQVELIGVVSAEPDVKDKISNLELAIQSVGRKKAVGKILISVAKFPEFRYGDKLKITGAISEPENFTDFNYKEYLARQGIYFVMKWPKVDLVAHHQASALMEGLFAFKKKFKTACQKYISPPQEGLLEALLFGDESNVPPELKDKFNITGTRHIAAVSGMNITIIASIIFSFMVGLGLGRKQTFYASIILLILYILMIGAPASAVRAGVMGIILMTAQYCGRLATASRAVVFAALIMLIINPLIFRMDLGFQLSFLAIMGMIFFQPAFHGWLAKIPKLGILDLRSTLSATLSAQMLTMPLILYSFGRLSLLAPLPNALIVPFLAPITILIFIFGIFALFFAPLAYFLSFFSWLALSYVIFVIDIFSRISFASLSLSGFSWIWLVIFYPVLIFWAFWLQRRQKMKFLEY